MDNNSAAINFSNAGHMPPIIFKNGNVSEFEKGTPAIGLMKTAITNNQEYELAPGEIMLLYSDGVTEAENEFGNFFGIERLLYILKNAGTGNPESLGNMLINHILKFTGSQKLHDDISLAILKRKS